MFIKGLKFGCSLNRVQSNRFTLTEYVMLRTRGYGLQEGLRGYQQGTEKLFKVAHVWYEELLSRAQFKAVMQWINESDTKRNITNH